MTPHPIIAEWLESCRYMRTLPYRQMPRIGDGLCRWCGAPVDGRRRSWCSDDCQTEFLIRWNPGSAAHHVYERDNGVCSACGIDTNEIRALYHDLNMWQGEVVYKGHRRIVYPPLRHYTPEEPRTPWGPWKRYNQRFWEMDHILPVIEGGGCCGLDNLRTLCLACHAAETKSLAGRRARARRAQMEFGEVANG